MSGFQRISWYILSAAWLGSTLGLLASAQEHPTEPPQKRGTATVEETRPAHFPHRIWAACDFEGQTPDYAWFGPTETKNIPNYPGNVTALGVKEKPYQNFSALMTGINPVPGPMMGTLNKMYCRYYLKGGREATFQHFSLSVNDNNHIRVSGLTEEKWSELTLNFTRDAARNDGSSKAFQKGERMDDLKVFVGKPKDGKDYELFLDDIIFFDDDPATPREKEPFPNRVIFHAAFDTGIDAKSKPKYWPGEFEVATKSKGVPDDSYWGVAQAVPHKDTKGKWIRLQIEPPRPVGAHTKVRFRYLLSGTSAMTVQVFDLADQDNRHIHLKDLKQGAWQWAILDFTNDAKRNDGKETPFAAGHKVDDLFFFVKPEKDQEVQLYVDEVTVFDAGKANPEKINNAPHPAVEKNVKVYAEPGRFGGWPANHGIWSWGDEILVGFSAGHFKDNGPNRHAIDHDKPEEHLLARSRDGGQTWTIENPADKGALIPVGKALHGVTPPGLKENPWQDCPGGIDFTHADFALAVRMTDAHAGPSRFYYTTDRGKTWQGPFRLPLFDQKGIAARTDYVVNGKHDCMLFLTAAKANGDEGRPLCVRTTDGGKTWSFIAWIGDEPKGYAIMPSTVRLGENELLSAIRCREGKTSWIGTYRSLDNAKTWKLDAKPAPDTGEGNPPSMIWLADGRVCLTYGYRAEPYGIRACLSSDAGRTWGKEFVLRGDGGGRDLGYPRSVQRTDGKVVTVYYFHDEPKGDRYIAATIWDPSKVGK